MNPAKPIIASGLVLLLLLFTPATSQIIHVIYTSGPVMLVADGYKHGAIQWESSADQINWSDVPGWDYDSVTFTAPTTTHWYRARIESGTCPVIYSEVQGMRLFQCGDTLVDERDGRVYPTVQIGAQCWMGKNMNVGVMIYGHLAMQNDSIIERYCFANDTNNCNTYGALYQWNEMMQYSTTPGVQGICPAGWHVPTDQEYITLELYLGMSPSVVNLMNTWRGTDQGAQMKQGGTSGFNANLTGLRYDGGLFYNQGTFEYLYTSNEHPSNTALALRRCLSSGDPSIGRYNNTSKTVGGSVRCIKDN